MTILHIALFRWNEGVTPDQVKALGAALDALRLEMPMLLTYQHGEDLGLREGNYDYGVVAELERGELVGDYLDHPLHQVFVQDYIKPMVAERRAVQITRRPE